VNEQSTIREVLGKINDASTLWNREPERFGTLMGEATAMLINLDFQADAYVRKLEQENSNQKLEIERLEKCLEDGDYYPCANCRGVWSCDDLADIGGENFCPRCVDEARRKDAEEAAQAKEDEREAREIHINNMRNAG
jgi:hypothetical protein